MEKGEVIIVLSGVKEPGNVGAVCRAMKNMGLSHLRLAGPKLRDGSDLGEAGTGFGGMEAVVRARAIHAEDVWEGAETFGSLAEAVRDCSLVVGTTRRRGRHRKQVSMTPKELAAFLASRPGPAAVVFGNERTGLDDGELELCNIASHIPVNEDFPSLNLSHAVQIYAYELFAALSPDAECAETVKGQWVPMRQSAIGEVADEITANLKSLGFYKQRDSEEQARFFRDLYSRAALTEREGRYLAGIFAKAARLAGK